MNLLMPASAHLDQPVAAAGDQLAAALPAEGQHTGLVTLQLPHALRRAATLPSSGVLLSAAQYLVSEAHLREAPHPHHGVPAPGGHQAVRGAEGSAPHAAGVTSQHSNLRNNYYYND